MIMYNSHLKAGSILPTMFNQRPEPTQFTLTRCIHTHAAAKRTPPRYIHHLHPEYRGHAA